GSRTGRTAADTRRPRSGVRCHGCGGRVRRRGGRARSRLDGARLTPARPRTRRAAAGQAGRRRRPLKIVVVSRVWPPPRGGPATHAPELCGFLLARGHRAEAVTMASAAPERQAYAVRWTSRQLPIGVRHALAAARIERTARDAHVVYSTGMLGRSSAGSAVA